MLYFQHEGGEEDVKSDSCPECHRSEKIAVFYDERTGEHILACGSCSDEILSWYLEYREDQLYVVTGEWLEDPEETKRRKEEERRREEEERREKENPLWVVVEFGMGTQEWPVFLTQEGAISAYQEKLDNLTKYHNTQVKWDKEDHGEDYDHEYCSIDHFKPGSSEEHIVGYSCSVDLWEGHTFSNYAWEITVGYGKFVITKRTSPKDQT